MKSRNRRNSFVFLALVVFLTMVTLQAGADEWPTDELLTEGKSNEVRSTDDKATYESLSDVEIGRIFFSREERGDLDELRRGRLVVRARPKLGLAVRKKARTDSAGFIVSSSGNLRVYSEGDFVAADISKNMEFPGDVRIGRRKSPSAASDDENRSAAEMSDASD